MIAGDGPRGGVPGLDVLTDDLTDVLTDDLTDVHGWPPVAEDGGSSWGV
jgi:hypothetical protein